MKVFSLICANGLGHYKRSIEILYALKKVRPEINITVACGKWQIDRMMDWTTSSDFWKEKGVSHIDYIVSPGVCWSNNPVVYENGCLTNWHYRLEDLPELTEADFVMSDNLSQVLHYRSDSILLGSFLWSDVLEAAFPHHKQVQDFVQEERILLSSHSTSMICLDDMAMPGVFNQTEAIKMPWFCSKQEHGARPKNYVQKIAFLGGATDSISHQLLQLAQQLSATEKFTLYLPSFLAEKLDHPSWHMEIFDFSQNIFSQLDAIVCRPGIGTLTDAVRFGVPVITVHERNNIEMEHNGSRVSSLNIGLNLGAVSEIAETCKRISLFLSSKDLSDAKANISARPAEGVKETISWILKNYK